MISDEIKKGSQMELKIKWKKQLDDVLPSVYDEIENGPAVHAREKHPWQSY